MESQLQTKEERKSTKPYIFNQTVLYENSHAMNTVVLLSDILMLFLHQHDDVCDLSRAMLILDIVMMS